MRRLERARAALEDLLDSPAGGRLHASAMSPDAAQPDGPRGASAGGPGTAGSGLAWGLLGILTFSASLPTARLAAMHLDPWFVSLGRALVAGLLAALLLA